jgi:hypothetical protein
MSAAGLGYLLVREGWSSQEADHRWTDGPVAKLVFDVPAGKAGTAGLRLTMLASTLEQQTVGFAAGGHSLGELKLNSDTQELAFDIPPEAVQDNKLEITLRLPDAHSPGDDPRLLGLSLRWIQLDAK